MPLAISREYEPTLRDPVQDMDLILVTAVETVIDVLSRVVAHCEISVSIPINISMNYNKAHVQIMMI